MFRFCEYMYILVTTSVSNRTKKQWCRPAMTAYCACSYDSGRLHVRQRGRAAPGATQRQDDLSDGRARRQRPAPALRRPQSVRLLPDQDQPRVSRCCCYMYSVTTWRTAMFSVVWWHFIFFWFLTDYSTQGSVVKSNSECFHHLTSDILSTLDLTVKIYEFINFYVLEWICSIF